MISKSQALTPVCSFVNHWKSALSFFKARRNSLGEMKAKPLKTKDKLTKLARDYATDEIPVFAYLTLIAGYGAGFSLLFLASTRKEKKLRELQAGEVIQTAIASYKLSRVVTMSFIGTPLRAPFTTRGESLKGGEVQDESRGRGLQKAIGNLLTCPFCFNVWSSTLLVFGFHLAPRATKQISTILTMAALGDVLHLGFRNARELSR